MPSKALEVNLACSRVDVTINERYEILQEVMSKYPGIMEGLNTFLKELDHPYKNWQFIIKEARGHALDYFHLLKAHPEGPGAANLYVDIFFEAVETSAEEADRADAADNLLLYLQKIIKDSGEAFPRFKEVLDYAFDHIRCFGEEGFFLFMKSYYQINRLAQGFRESAPSGTDYTKINALLAKYLEGTYQYWLGEEDPRTWFINENGNPSPASKSFEEIFRPVTHEQLGTYLKEVETITEREDQRSAGALERLVSIPGYSQIVGSYREIPRKLFEAGEETGQGNTWKLIFLFHIMNTSGLSSIHEETLRGINRSLTWFIGHKEIQDVQRMIEKTFAILKGSVRRYPGTALSCVLNAGKAVYKTDESDLVDYFMDAVVDLGFHAPETKGFGDDWKVQANGAHVQNIRTWLELIEQNPKWSKKLISSLIIQLSLRGVLIRDTDLFPRDITGFLNSDIGPVFNLAKHLAGLFPAYFNDIGAEGDLRDISTRIDEISLRKDLLVHFLRKQSHVESSNQTIPLMESTLEFWRTGKKEGLRPLVPPEVYSQIEAGGPYVEGVHRVMAHLFKARGLSGIGDLLKLREEEVRGISRDLTGVSEQDLERVELAVRFYKLLYRKYNLSFIELETYLERLPARAFPDMDKLREALAESDTRQKLFKLLSYLERLKGLILSPVEYEIREDIYHKRHFAEDIPSMYGSYHEMKFDTLGLTFRLESLVDILFDELVEKMDLTLITRATFSRIYDYLRLFYHALRLDGISSLEMERQLDFLAHSLKVKGFSFTQFLDIFRGFSQAVKHIVTDYFDSIYRTNLARILGQLPVEALLPKYRPQGRPPDQEKLVHMVSEIFLRERISSSLGLQQLDVFLSRIMNTLHQQSDVLSGEKLGLLLNYDPQKTVTPINPINKAVSDIIYLGNKGLNLVRLNRHGFPVPPGFIVTTEIFRYREIIDRYAPTGENLKNQVARQVSALENVTGRTLGDPGNPLLLSVRSGAPISQPGMMDTFLDVGINEDVVQGIATRTRETWFAWDCYRRFLQFYGMAYGLDRNDFDDVMKAFKDQWGVAHKRFFTGNQMKELALGYKDLIRDNGVHLETSPFEQLYAVMMKVFDSWHSPKAKSYRRIMGISEDWGTAVSIQQMVFGNLSQQSGSGVLFTHSPRSSSDMVRLWGDFTLGNQGEDVVSGLVKTLPISKRQAEMENREGDVTLETHFPEIYRTIRELAKDLIYNKKWGPQEMEFTFESPLKKDLYFLQTRDMAIRESKKVLSFVSAPDSGSRLLCHGIGVSGGAMTGRLVYNLDEIHRWREKEPQTSLILVRGDTVPDDINEIYEADGLLTARGGSTSHAAVVAHRLGKTCVVGCANLVCMEKESSCSLNQVFLRSGDRVSIDGREGSIYSGTMKIKETERM
jgi:pyruvate,orthophosphate dikinase